MLIFKPFGRKKGYIMKSLEKVFKEYGHEKEYKADHTIAKVGTESNHMYYIISGSVNVSKMVGKKKIIFATFKAGDFFGEMSLISHKKHMSTMEVNEESTILSLTQKKVEQLLSENSDFAVGIVKGLIERLRKTDKYLIDAFSMAMEIDKAVKI